MDRPDALKGGMRESCEPTPAAERVSFLISLLIFPLFLLFFLFSSSPPLFLLPFPLLPPAFPLLHLLKLLTSYH